MVRDTREPTLPSEPPNTDGRTGFKRSEIQPGGELDLSRAAKSEQTAKLVSDCRCTASEGRTSTDRTAAGDTARRIRIVRSIEEVEDLDPQIQRHPFRKLSVLK